MNNISVYIFIVISSLLMTSCTTVPSSAPNYLLGNEGLEETYFDVNIPTHDGKLLRATIFQPALAPGEKAPLILHAHGFGVFRMSGPISIYGLLVYPGKAAKEAWRQGYWVISYDERGHGGSEDIIRVMDPEYEVRDVTTVIDWAEKNLRRITVDEKRDPLVGMIGESYGGGASLMGATQDKRIDAIIPVNTWNSFETSLAPNRVPKSGWLTTLILVGNSFNPGSMEPLLNQAYWQAREGIIEKEIFDYLSPHSTFHNCQNGKYPEADVLIIQGFRDVLFPINEGIRNRECLLRKGKDIRFIGAQGGHLLPFTQWSLIPGYTLESDVHCGDKKLNLIQVAVNWFDEKLKGKKDAAKNIPGMCLTQGYDRGIVVGDILKGGEYFEFENIEVNSGFSGFFESPLYLLDRLIGFVTPTMKHPRLEDHAELSGTLRPAFYPLKTFDGAMSLTGIPKLRVSIVATEQEEPVVFIGIGVKRARSRHIELVSDQIVPLRGDGLHDIDMMAVSTRLEPGDIVGITAAGYSNQYRFSGGDWFSKVTLSGSINVPILSL